MENDRKSSEGNHDSRLLIRTTENLGIKCKELSEKLGWGMDLVVSEMLQLGSEALENIADGKNVIIIQYKFRKMSVSGYIDKSEIPNQKAP